ncbi:hypothetical protein ES702_01706 [subsurface metagenome]
MTELEFTKCLVCGWSRPLERKGTKRIQRDQSADKQYTFRYDVVDPNEAAFISIRECGGRGKGFKEIRKITLKEAIENDSYKEVRESLKNQCVKVLKILIGEEE